MNEIVRKADVGPGVVQIHIAHAKLARKARPGQFVILRVTDSGERFPLTIVDCDPDAGTIRLVFQVVGKSTFLLAKMGVGERILDVVGPLGLASDIERYGRVLCVGGGVGVAPLYPIAKALKEAGNDVTAILGARSRNLLMLEDEFSATADRVVIATDDGSYGRRGFVTDVLDDLMTAGETFDRAWAIGPVIMMQAVCTITRRTRIPTVVSLNPIMVDGTGMCGGCRVIVGGEVKFACVDGPEFDGHLVDFDSLARRLTAYGERERRDYEACRIGLDRPQSENRAGEPA